MKSNNNTTSSKNEDINYDKIQYLPKFDVEESEEYMSAPYGGILINDKIPYDFIESCPPRVENTNKDITAQDFYSSMKVIEHYTNISQARKIKEEYDLKSKIRDVVRDIAEEKQEEKERVIEIIKGYEKFKKENTKGCKCNIF